MVIVALTAMFEQDVINVASKATKLVEAPFRGDGLRNDYCSETLNADMKIKKIEEIKICQSRQRSSRKCGDVVTSVEGNPDGQSKIEFRVTLTE